MPFDSSGFFKLIQFSERIERFYQPLVVADVAKAAAVSHWLRVETGYGLDSNQAQGVQGDDEDPKHARRSGASGVRTVHRDSARTRASAW
jgi:hypothetical protein